jgi:hypothetical protein
MDLKMTTDSQMAIKEKAAFALVVTFLVLLFSASFLFVESAPQGVVVLYNNTENASYRPAESHTAAGGSFTTLVLNVTSQTSKWKAYVGNVSGKLTLDNSNNMTIYDWTLTTVQGEVYVSRNNSISFGSLMCANSTHISNEESNLSINSTSDDSINRTFSQKAHKSFVIGGAGAVANSTCYSISTYIGDTSQSASESAVFQEVLMSDGTSMVYVSILEDSKVGFDNSFFDFQMIVPDNPTEVSNAYYFYAELG